MATCCRSSPRPCKTGPRSSSRSYRGRTTAYVQCLTVKCLSMVVAHCSVPLGETTRSWLLKYIIMQLNVVLKQVSRLVSALLAMVFDEKSLQLIGTENKGVLDWQHINIKFLLRSPVYHFRGLVWATSNRSLRRLRWNKQSVATCDRHGNRSLPKWLWVTLETWSFCGLFFNDMDIF